jgi:hypothetical protein
MPEAGGLKAESGRVGRDFGPLLRAPTPGEMGGGVMGLMGVVRVAIIARVIWMELISSTAFASFKYSVLLLSHVPSRFCLLALDLSFYLLPFSQALRHPSRQHTPQE